MKRVTLTLCLLLLINFLIAQNIGGQLNYTQSLVTAIDPGNGAITLANASGFDAADRVLVIQMQGSTVSTANDASFGQIQNPNGPAGLFEIVTVCQVTGNEVVLDKNMANTYDVAGKVQVIKIPVLFNVTVSSELTTSAWDGNSGGVLVLEANTITLNADINMSGKGFRGGTFLDGNYNCGPLPFTGLNEAVYFSPDFGGAKGEGTGSYAHDFYYGYAPLASGGGGGNDHNTGGGGGSNISRGGRGGENGTSNFFECKGQFSGEGGYGLTADDRLYLGGGGGAGHGNNNQGSSGAGGGGIIILKANLITGSGQTISVDGEDGEPTTTLDAVDGEDGAGAGGAAGSIYVDIIASSGVVNLSLQGGNGGDAAHSGPLNDCFGPGGGGAGGLLKFRGTAQTSYNVNLSGGTNGTNTIVPGSNGTTSCLGSAVGGAPGAGGVQLVEQGSILEGSLNNDACNLVLPIELLSFQAIKVNEEVLLSWESASEKDFSHFDIERSSDGISFSGIGAVLASGDSEAGANYEFLDREPGSGANYYRLRLVERDDSYTVSKIQVVSFQTSVDMEPVFFPNPVVAGQTLKLKLQSSQSGVGHVSLFSVDGRRALSEVVSFQKGESILSVGIPETAPGIYFVEWVSENRVFRKKILVE